MVTAYCRQHASPAFLWISQRNSSPGTRGKFHRAFQADYSQKRYGEEETSRKLNFWFRSQTVSSTRATCITRLIILNCTFSWAMGCRGDTYSTNIWRKSCAYWTKTIQKNTYKKFANNYVLGRNCRHRFCKCIFFLGLWQVKVEWFVHTSDKWVIGSRRDWPEISDHYWPIQVFSTLGYLTPTDFEIISLPLLLEIQSGLSLTHNLTMQSSLVLFYNN